MGVKNIHVVLIIVSIILSLGFGFWTLGHNYILWGYASFVLAAALTLYCVKFVKKMKAL
ncbi:MAG: hypothetical protein KGK03_07020 [Candidatus Omnitrophica bacterium]|nr:hypothetical protein [Candidatus Omnitrophota bacterium]MDE2222804.1 hypothetical protein [Candidatus Omnitrophota bacterium]